jgi:hypothetical protein
MMSDICTCIRARICFAFPQRHPACPDMAFKVDLLDRLGMTGAVPIWKGWHEDKLKFKQFSHHSLSCWNIWCHRSGETTQNGRKEDDTNIHTYIYWERKDDAKIEREREGDGEREKREIKSETDYEWTKEQTCYRYLIYVCTYISTYYLSSN